MAPTDLSRLYEGTVELTVLRFARQYRNMRAGITSLGVLTEPLRKAEATTGM